MGGKDQLPVMSDATTIVGAVVARARVAQAAFDAATQEEVDEVVTIEDQKVRCIFRTHLNRNPLKP